MSFLSLVFGFFVGFIIGIFVYAQLLLRILYGLPKSLYLWANGKLKFMGVISQLITPLIWIVIILVLAFSLEMFAPSINKFIITNKGTVFGQVLAIIVLLGNFFSRSGRADMAFDFDKTTIERYKKESKISYTETEVPESLPESFMARDSRSNKIFHFTKRDNADIYHFGIQQNLPSKTLKERLNNGEFILVKPEDSLRMVSDSDVS